MSRPTVPGPREAVFLGVIKALSGIVPGNGYATEAGLNIFRVDLTPEQVGTRNTALMVLEPLGGEVYVPYDAKVYEAKLPIVVAGFVHKASADPFTADVHADLNALITDVLGALITDATFGGACKDSVVERCTTFVDVARSEGYFAINLHATYHFSTVTIP